MRHLPLLLALTLLTPALLAQEATTAPTMQRDLVQPEPTPEDANIDEAAEKKVLADVIDKAIKLLEEKKHGEVLELLAPRAMVEHEKQNGDYPKLLRRAEKIGDSLLKALRAAQGKEPEFKRNGNYVRAVYPEPDKKGDFESIPQLTFTRLQGQWTLK